MDGKGMFSQDLHEVVEAADAQYAPSGSSLVAQVSCCGDQKQGPAEEQGREEQAGCIDLAAVSPQPRHQLALGISARHLLAPSLEHTYWASTETGCCAGSKDIRGVVTVSSASQILSSDLCAQRGGHLCKISILPWSLLMSLTGGGMFRFVNIFLPFNLFLNR